MAAQPPVPWNYFSKMATRHAVEVQQKLILNNIFLFSLNYISIATEVRRGF